MIFGRSWRGRLLLYGNFLIAESGLKDRVGYWGYGRDDNMAMHGET